LEKKKIKDFDWLIFLYLIS